MAVSVANTNDASMGWLVLGFHNRTAAARDLGLGWKVSPSIDIAAGETVTLMDVDGPGVLRHLWLTTDRTVLRSMVLRIYWDGEPEPAADLSVGEFFCNAWEELALLDSETIVVAPAGGPEQLRPMPFPAVRG
jgi:hypothetical protein